MSRDRVKTRQWPGPLEPDGCICSALQVNAHEAARLRGIVYDLLVAVSKMKHVVNSADNLMDDLKKEKEVVKTEQQEQYPTLRPNVPVWRAPLHLDKDKEQVKEKIVGHVQDVERCNHLKRYPGEMAEKEGTCVETLCSSVTSYDKPEYPNLFDEDRPDCFGTCDQDTYDHCRFCKILEPCIMAQSELQEREARDDGRDNQVDQRDGGDSQEV